ncbi:1-deoxy-D-xylulose-5-phosphate reductoisomerase [Proteus terrae]|uniref:1-deoxy-D-xylulose-5-phosphate reductoisomerase n=1 Tax=Proteus terrae TaxID=1574161 RepID=UPI0021BA51D2|nr:1-deoxy-D-xylulose-5-phosphate reductoisomerase [Proteus terrae]MCT8264917.1 1-deoxy-D-xylulose-5-phosphate reductoisomerase [Proteus terrae]
MKQITILGSTGSIGTSTLSVIENNPDEYQVLALAAGKNADKMAQQCLVFQPKYAVMSDEKSANQLKQLLANTSCKTEILSGSHAINEIAALDEADQVMSAITGVAGLKPTLAAIEKGKRILLANKESLITSGRLFFDAVAKYGATVLPIDSEHNAIYQSLPKAIQENLGHASLADEGVTSILLTGSGGPFRYTPLEELEAMTPDQACAHPNWSMGRKISVDSATMMNKGLEYIEARYFFNASEEEMEVIIHPQSVIHSMVRYRDGSIIAQIGEPDMRTPIAYSMAYPHRTQSGAKALDFFEIQSLEFIRPDYQRYPCLALAIEASKRGQAATTVLNAANEVVVDAFLHEKVKFTDIAKINRKVVEHFDLSEPQSINDVLEIDKLARLETHQIITQFV